MNIKQFVNKNALKHYIKHTSLSGNKDGYFKITKEKEMKTQFIEILNIKFVAS
jgi:hypothetical protein